MTALQIIVVVWTVSAFVVGSLVGRALRELDTPDPFAGRSLLNFRGLDEQ